MRGIWDTFGLAFFLMNLSYAFFVYFAYHRKKRIKSAELEYFGKLVNINFIASICVIFCGATLANLGADNIFTQLFNRLYIVLLLIYNWYFAIYVVIISLTDDEIDKYQKKINIISMVIFVVNLILSLLLPIELVYDERGMFSTGPAIYNLFIFGLLSCILGGYFMHHGLHKNHYKIRRYIPTIVSVVILITIDAVQLTQLISIMETLVVIVMYFTVENPDIKIIEELKIAKEEAEKTNDEKTFFLSRMSREIRTPLTAVVGFSEDITDRRGETTEEVYEKAQKILDLSIQVQDAVNNILDYNRFDSSTTEVKNVIYDVAEEMEKTFKLIIDNYDGNNTINYYFFENIPKYLEGDIYHIKECINKIIAYYVNNYNNDLMLTVVCREKDNKCTIGILFSDDFIYSNNDINLSVKGKDFYNEEFDTLNRFIEAYDGELRYLDDGKILYSIVQKITE